jgi:hypothetical protein
VTATPQGCQYCGIPRSEHMQRWTQAAGWHQWEQPTQQQTKARMNARRNARRPGR